MCSFTLSLTSALDGGGWLVPCPGCFSTRRVTLYPLHRRLGGPPGPAWMGLENLAPIGILSLDLRAHSLSPSKFYEALALRTDILEMKEYTAFILKVAGVLMNSSFSKMKAIYTFETMEIRNPVKQCKKPEDQNPQHQRLGNLKALM